MKYGSSFLQFLYYRSPALFRNVFATGYGLQQRWARYGHEFELALEFLRKSQYWSNDLLLENQRSQIDDFFRSVLPHTAYYLRKEVYADWGSGVKFEDLPIISKREVRENMSAFFNEELNRLPHRWAHTSGTTGTSLIFPVSVKAFQREYAYRALHNSWGNVSLKGRDRIAYFAGHPVASPDRQTPPFWALDVANNALFFSSYHLTARNLELYIRELERFQPAMIMGYPSSVYLMALAYRKHGSDRLRLRSIFTSSETLFDFQRAEIESSFGTKVFNYYGCSEMCVNAMECEKGEMHLKLEHSAVEVLDAKNEPCKPGETGRVVCTGFGNTAFPLIRYEIGDEATLSSKQHSLCGRGGILLERILGRLEDYIATPDGRLVGRLDHLFKDSKNVVEAQLAQDSLNEVLLRIVKGPQFSSKDEYEIGQAARRRLGPSVRVRFQYVDQVPRTKAGKFRFIDSTLDQKELLKDLIS